MRKEITSGDFFCSSGLHRSSSLKKLDALGYSTLRRNKSQAGVLRIYRNSALSRQTNLFLQCGSAKKNAAPSGAALLIDCSQFKIVISGTPISCNSRRSVLALDVRGSDPASWFSVVSQTLFFVDNTDAVNFSFAFFNSAFKFNIRWAIFKNQYARFVGHARMNR